MVRFLHLTLLAALPLSSLAFPSAHSQTKRNIKKELTADDSADDSRLEFQVISGDNKVELVSHKQVDDATNDLDDGVLESLFSSFSSPSSQRSPSQDDTNGGAPPRSNHTSTSPAEKRAGMPQVIVPDSYPASAVGKVFTRIGRSTGHCSGALIGPRYVLTKVPNNLTDIHGGLILTWISTSTQSTDTPAALATNLTTRLSVKA
ncbi:Uu.00g144090.m01.CDS01 [Anthostomella pinea]|uniref:Uu.00g144090.m01.CDS01 n=1 Tax=Anthostomella pinea TaxID=933095 RepID=A0AAI8VQT0_9PEZI|nr:Uu.00g144090.m01.CDS01 [Anthostomella pinea]